MQIFKFFICNFFLQLAILAISPMDCHSPEGRGQATPRRRRHALHQQQLPGAVLFLHEGVARRLVQRQGRRVLRLNVQRDVRVARARQRWPSPPPGRRWPPGASCWDPAAPYHAPYQTSDLRGAVCVGRGGGRSGYLSNASAPVCSHSSNNVN